jgi:hypothetical protein
VPLEHCNRPEAVRPVQFAVLFLGTFLTLCPEMRMVHAAESLPRSHRSPLTVAVPVQEEVRGGRTAELKVELSNRSASELVLTDESGLRSYDFTLQTPTGGQSYAGVVGSAHETEPGRLYCPANGHVVSLRPGQKSIRIIKVPIPRELLGTVHVTLGVRFFRIADSVQCSPVELIDITAKGTLTVTQSRAP